MRRYLRVGLVCVLTLSMSVDSAWAGRWFGRCLQRCQPIVSRCVRPHHAVSVSCAPACCPTTVCSSSVEHTEPTPVSGDCGCDSTVASGPAVMSGTVISEPTLAPSVGVPHDAMPGEVYSDSAIPAEASTASEPNPTWAATESSTDQTVNKPAESETLPLDDEPAPTLAEDEATDEATEEDSPADVEPMTEEPAVAAEQPADDGGLFGEQPAEEPADDGGLFGDEPADEPMADVAPEPTDDDGLFGEPADEPAEVAAEEPADDGGLFGEPTDEPADEGGLFGETTEEPAADVGGLFGEPADEPAAEPADDGGLFGEPTTEAPAEEPMEETDGGLFGAPVDEPAAEAADDGGLFGEPAVAPADEPADDGGLFGEPADDSGLFGEPVDKPADAADAAPAPAEEPSDEEEEGGLFDFGGILQENGGLESLALRKWVDNTGVHTVHARLLNVLDGKVKLLKANGRTSTVPFHRLSSSDLEFVNLQATAQKSRVLSQTAQR